MRLTKFLVAVALVIGLTSKLLAQSQPPGTLAWKNGFPAATNAQPGQFFGFVDVQGTFTVNAGWKVSITVEWIPNPAPRGAQPMGRGVDPFLGNWGENKVAFPGGPTVGTDPARERKIPDLGACRVRQGSTTKWLATRRPTTTSGRLVNEHLQHRDQVNRALRLEVR